MSQPVPVPASVYYGLAVILDAEAYFMSLRSYVTCAAERGLFTTARWIASNPATFGAGLLYGFTPYDPDEVALKLPAPALPSFRAVAAV